MAARPAATHGAAGAAARIVLARCGIVTRVGRLATVRHVTAVGNMASVGVVTAIVHVTTVGDITTIDVVTSIHATVVHVEYAARIDADGAVHAIVVDHARRKACRRAADEEATVLHDG